MKHHQAIKKKKTTDTLNILKLKNINQENQIQKAYIHHDSLYKIQEQIKLSYGYKNQNSGYFCKRASWERAPGYFS